MTRKDRDMHFRVTQEELGHWQNVASRLGYRLFSEFVRAVLNSATGFTRPPPAIHPHTVAPTEEHPDVA